MLLLYNIMLWLAALFLVPWYLTRMLVTGKYRKGLGQRFGLLPPAVVAGLSGSPRIWFHAVSVGEVTAAAPIIDALRKRLPQAGIVLSTTTDTGQEMARRIVTAANAFIYYPLDISCAVCRSIDMLRPDIFVLTETELWPNFISRCRALRVKVMMVNGRLSSRSFRRYALTGFFWKRIIDTFTGVGVISELDAGRFRRLGLPTERLEVCGNAKYDSLAAKPSPHLLEEIRARLNISAGEPVLVAGSTHEGEEAIILGIYKELLTTYPACKLIIVPRHIERTEDIILMAQQYGFMDIITLTAIVGGQKRREERVVIVDVIGELFKVYGLATVVFCGGSLVPRGGQNILEAAAWGKVIFYGPYMDDFREESALLEAAGAGIMVRDSGELLSGMLKLLADPAALSRRGEAGRRLIAANSGAADRYAELIINCLPEV